MTSATIARAVLHHAHALILLAGVLGLLSVIASLVSRWIGAPILLAFLGLGMLAGPDGVLGLSFHDPAAAYLTGSMALAVILFEGGLKTPPETLRAVFWPAATLATIGVGITAAITGLGVAWLDRTTLAGGMVIGAILAPTDAAAVSALLRGARAAVPERLLAVLEVESGLNDPISVMLTIMLLRVVAGDIASGWEIVEDVAVEMLGGAAIGLGMGAAIAMALRRLRIEPALSTVFVVAATLATFGLAQLVGASGFLATYLAGIMAGRAGPAIRARIEPFFEGLGWLAQIVLFLMLGLLVAPHSLPSMAGPALIAAMVLILIARPVASFACLAPFGFSRRESAFVAWVGLRGGVPIYLSLIPALAGPDARHRDALLFTIIVIVVIASLLVQGWTIRPAARLIGFGREGDDPVSGARPAP